MKINVGEYTCIYGIHYTGIGMYYIIFIMYKVFKKIGNCLITICTFLSLHNIAITDNNRMQIC